MQKIKLIMIIFVLVTLLGGCSNNKENMENRNSKETVDNKNKTEIKVTVEEAKKLIDENNDLVILDVRTKEEYDTGHIKNAILMPYDTIQQDIDEIEQYKDKPILVYCRTGRRSSIAVKTLTDNLFTKIYHMYQGISVWKYELEK